MKTKSKTTRNGKMCKDKWNSINGDYKKIFDCHKGMGHNTSYWDLSLEDWDKFHLPKQFNENCYNTIKVFQGEKNINDLLHMKDLNALGDGVFYGQLLRKELEKSFQLG